MAAALVGCAAAPHADRIMPGRNYVIKGYSGLVMDSQESYSPGAGIFLAKPVAGKESQVWQFVKVADGVYCIVSPLSSFAIDNSNAPRPGTGAIQWTLDRENANQHWRVTENPDGTYSFQGNRKPVVPFIDRRTPVRRAADPGHCVVISVPTLDCGDVQSHRKA